MPLITLADAFRLCNVRDEAVYLRHIEEHGSWSSHYFWSKKIRDKFDMKKIRVLRIDLEFAPFDPEFAGWRFVVTGISPEELHAAEWAE